ncbi:MPI (predicted) [Pycnogonum litorale]
MSSDSVFLLKNAMQSYAWGKLGYDSEVAKLSRNACPGTEIIESKPYAELWMGAHPRGPSIIQETETNLADYIVSRPECLGQTIIDKFGPTLPFLFKVLSVNKSLSIQAHPNKADAEKLHGLYPDKYPDPNHKPEMAIALTKFQALCGFRPVDEILKHLNDIPELSVVVGDGNIQELQNEKSSLALRKCFTSLMTCGNNVVEDNLAKLVSRLKLTSETGGSDKCLINDNLDELFLRVHSEFPGDVGCFVLYFLNVMILEAGQAMFLPANEPHAYLRGDCIECMACSDNVVRSGLTPKFKDISLLCEMLTYESGVPEDRLFKGVVDPSDPDVTVFNPPVPDFAVNAIKIDGIKRKKIQKLASASILLVIDGEASLSTSATTDKINLRKGSVLFVHCNEELVLDVSSNTMLMFRAYV